MKNHKALLLAGLFAVLALVGVVSGYNQYVATKFNDIEVDDILLNGNDILDSAGVTRITVGSTVAISGNATISGTFTPTSLTIVTSTAPRDVNSSVAITPTAAGQLVYNSTDKELCVSTAAVIRSWIEVSTFGVVACRH